MGLASILSLGFFLGMRHATDADHVVAVSTIVARNKKLGTAWLLGAFWGIGHTVTIFIVGAAIIVFKVVIPDRLGLGMEFSVGIALILLGALNMAGFRLGAIGLREHSHPHTPDDPEHRHLLLEPLAEGGSAPHSHAHVHEAPTPWLRRIARDAGMFQLARSLAVGLVHGLAGSAAVALLVLATIRSPRAAVVYLAVFGGGTLAGMLILSTLMELCMLYVVRWWKTAEWLLLFGTGLLSLLFGLWVAYQIGFVDGLFRAQTHWTPR